MRTLGSALFVFVWAGLSSRRVHVVDALDGAGRGGREQVPNVAGMQNFCAAGAMLLMLCTFLLLTTLCNACADRGV